MEFARTSMTHACAPHFLCPYAVRYAAHQLNLRTHVSRLEVSPTSLWTRSPGAASCFRVWGCLALVRDTSVDKILPRAVPCVFLGFLEDSSDYTFYHPPLHRFFASRDVRFDKSLPYYARCSLLPRSPPPSLHPAGAGFRGEDPGGASSRGVGVGAESVPVRDPGSGGAGVGAEPVTAGDSSLRGASVSGAVPGGATIGGAPSAGPGQSGTNPITSGGAGSGGEERELERQELELQRLEEQQQQPEQEQEQQQPRQKEQQQTLQLEEQRSQPQQEQQQQPPPPPVSGLWTLGLPSPSPPSPPSPPVSGPPLPPRDPSQAIFPPFLPPVSPPLSHTWPSRRSPRARPSSPPPFTDLRTALFCSSPPPLSPSVLPSPPESALTASLSTPVIDYYRTCRLFASTRCLDYATSLVAAPPTSPLAVGGESTRSSSVSTSTAEAEIYIGAMAAQELRWLTFFLTYLGERPSSAPTLFIDNKATILLCREPHLESRVKHISVSLVALLLVLGVCGDVVIHPELCFFVPGLVTVHFWFCLTPLT
ncbi:unnamed protein product [Closterium sp. NIES-54]